MIHMFSLTVSVSGTFAVFTINKHLCTEHLLKYIVQILTFFALKFATITTAVFTATDLNKQISGLKYHFRLMSIKQNRLTEHKCSDPPTTKFRGLKTVASMLPSKLKAISVTRV